MRKLIVSEFITRRGIGSLVFSNDADFTRDTVLGIGDLHGRVLVVVSTVGSQHTGQCGTQLSARWPGKGRRGRGACRPACVVALSPPFCRARTSQLHQAIVGIVR